MPSWYDIRDIALTPRQSPTGRGRIPAAAPRGGARIGRVGMGEKNAPLQADGNGGLQDQFEKLRQLAAKDALSGLLNRATMEQYIKARLQTMGREETCALFIVDLDDFKRVNDTLGHMAGDEAIRTSGRILSGLFRANDIVGRLGGDEFAVFLCGEITEELVRQKAAAICEQLHLALGDRETLNVTASVGVYLASSGQAFEGLYQTADLALYKDNEHIHQRSWWLSLCGHSPLFLADACNA